MLNNKYFIYSIFWAFGILLGVFFCNFSYFVFEKTIRLADLLSIGITGFLGIYIATSVNKVFTRNHSEKEFLIKEIKSSLKVVNELIGLIHDKSLPFGKAVNNFKIINEDLLLIERLINSSHCKGIDVSVVRNELIILRNNVTKISPVNGNIILDSTNYNIARVQILKLKSFLYNLVFEINRK
ncbi:MAG: hypothetical protein JWR02_2470 [Mucilaginibacter sp.]|nr:hypothetical protein [Mucilaginibacter sp.]